VRLDALACAIALGCVGIPGHALPTAPAAALLAKRASLGAELATNQFHRPLYMESIETADAVRGEAYALLGQPFQAALSLGKAASWCDLLTLHQNTKQCLTSIQAHGTMVHVSIGKKVDQAAADAHRVDFAYTVAASGADYLQVKLDAPEGPLGTRDYRIVLEAAPAEAGRTFIRLSYSYSYGTLAKVAMQAYLGTTGRSKVGFTQVQTLANGTPVLVGGMRGLVERNTMRYFLAIEAFLGALSSPAEARIEKSLQDWFAAAERFPRQLHELEREDYLAMKRKEYSRQRSGS
jgi:hypothetical protein